MRITGSASSHSQPNTKPRSGLVHEDEFALEATSRDALREAIRINGIEIARLKETLSEVQAALSERVARDEYLKRVSALWKDQEKSESHRIPDNFAARQRQRRTSMAWRVRREAYLILKRANRPLNRTELLRELRVAGVELNAHDPLAAITKIMWNATEFESTGGGYWLAGEPIPAD